MGSGFLMVAGMEIEAAGNMITARTTTETGISVSAITTEVVAGTRMSKGYSFAWYGWELAPSPSFAVQRPLRECLLCRPVKSGAAIWRERQAILDLSSSISLR
jgi:hypothetical protein